jgi:Lipase
MFACLSLQSSYKSASIQLIKDSYLDGPEDMNIIGKYSLFLCSITANFQLNCLNSEAVDWGVIASDRLYLMSAFSTRNVGENVAELIGHMIDKHDVSLSNIHIIGHSLGAHAAGHTGMYVNSHQGKKISRITGLGGIENMQKNFQQLIKS